MAQKSQKRFFDRFTRAVSDYAGRPAVFSAAFGVVLAWGLTGPVFGYSNTWQLIINTGTTIITFLMVFLIQNTQNKDTTALQLKLDELIRATEGAHTVLLDLEELTPEELASIRRKYQRIAEESRQRRRSNKNDTDTPEVVLNEKVP